jgi:hypothetical protein
MSFDKSCPAIVLADAPAHAVDILRFLGRCSRQLPFAPDRPRRRKQREIIEAFREAVGEAIAWLGSRIEQLTGISQWHVRFAMARLAEGDSLEESKGGARVMRAGLPVVVPGPRADLSGIPQRLRDMDRDGITASLWQRLCTQWPSLADAWRTRHKARLRTFGYMPTEAELLDTATQQPAGDSQPPAPEPRVAEKPAKQAKGKHIDERMLAALRDKPESLYWSANQWKDHLHCSKSTVIDSKTWKQTCKPARERERLARGKRLRTKNPR